MCLLRFFVSVRIRFRRLLLAYAEELEYNIDFLIDPQDIRQCHSPCDQNRAEDRYEEEAYNYNYDYNYNPNEEGQR